MAHLTLEYANNVPFPKMLRLLNLLEKYSTITHMGNKEDVKVYASLMHIGLLFNDFN